MRTALGIRGPAVTREQYEAEWVPFRPFGLLLSDAVASLRWSRRYHYLRQLFSLEARNAAAARNDGNFLEEGGRGATAATASSAWAPPPAMMDYETFRRVMTNTLQCAGQATVRSVFAVIDADRDGLLSEVDFLCGVLAAASDAPHSVGARKSFGSSSTTESECGIHPLTLIRLQLLYLYFDEDLDGSLSHTELAHMLSLLLPRIVSTLRQQRMWSGEERLGPVSHQIYTDLVARLAHTVAADGLSSRSRRPVSSRRKIGRPPVDYNVPRGAGPSLSNIVFPAAEKLGELMGSFFRRSSSASKPSAASEVPVHRSAAAFADSNDVSCASAEPHADPHVFGSSQSTAAGDSQLSQQQQPLPDASFVQQSTLTSTIGVGRPGRTNLRVKQAAGGGWFGRTCSSNNRAGTGSMLSCGAMDDVVIDQNDLIVDEKDIESRPSAQMRFVDSQQLTATPPTSSGRIRIAVGTPLRNAAAAPSPPLYLRLDRPLECPPKPAAAVRPPRLLISSRPTGPTADFPRLTRNPLSEERRNVTAAARGGRAPGIFRGGTAHRPSSTASDSSKKAYSRGCKWAEADPFVLSQLTTHGIDRLAVAILQRYGHTDTCGEFYLTFSGYIEALTAGDIPGTTLLFRLRPWTLPTNVTLPVVSSTSVGATTTAAAARTTSSGDGSEGGFAAHLTTWLGDRAVTPSAAGPGVAPAAAAATLEGGGLAPARNKLQIPPPTSCKVSADGEYPKQPPAATATAGTTEGGGDTGPIGCILQLNDKSDLAKRSREEAATSGVPTVTPHVTPAPVVLSLAESSVRGPPLEMLPPTPGKGLPAVATATQNANSFASSSAGSASAKQTTLAMPPALQFPNFGTPAPVTGTHLQQRFAEFQACLRTTTSAYAGGSSAVLISTAATTAGTNSTQSLADTKLAHADTPAAAAGDGTITMATTTAAARKILPDFYRQIIALDEDNSSLSLSLDTTLLDESNPIKRVDAAPSRPPSNPTVTESDQKRRNNQSPDSSASGLLPMCLAALNDLNLPPPTAGQEKPSIYCRAVAPTANSATHTSLLAPVIGGFDGEIDSNTLVPPPPARPVNGCDTDDFSGGGGMFGESLLLSSSISSDSCRNVTVAMCKQAVEERSRAESLARRCCVLLDAPRYKWHSSCATNSSINSTTDKLRATEPLSASRPATESRRRTEWTQPTSTRLSAELIGELCEAVATLLRSEPPILDICIDHPTPLSVLVSPLARPDAKGRCSLHPMLSNFVWQARPTSAPPSIVDDDRENIPALPPKCGRHRRGKAEATYGGASHTAILLGGISVGHASVSETIDLVCLLFAAKILHPSNLYLLRGCLDDSLLTADSSLGLQNLCVSLFGAQVGSTVGRRLAYAIELLPIMAVAQSKRRSCAVKAVIMNGDAPSDVDKALSLDLLHKLQRQPSSAKQAIPSVLLRLIGKSSSKAVGRASCEPQLNPLTIFQLTTAKGDALFAARSNLMRPAVLKWLKSREERESDRYTPVARLRMLHRLKAALLVRRDPLQGVAVVEHAAIDGQLKTLLRSTAMRVYLGFMEEGAKLPQQLPPRPEDTAAAATATGSSSGGMNHVRNSKNLSLGEKTDSSDYGDDELPCVPSERGNASLPIGTCRPRAAKILNSFCNTRGCNRGFASQ